jgi:hypothetical protein
MGVVIPITRYNLLYQDPKFVLQRNKLVGQKPQKKTKMKRKKKELKKESWVKRKGERNKENLKTRNEKPEDVLATNCNPSLVSLLSRLKCNNSLK